VAELAVIAPRDGSGAAATAQGAAVGCLGLAVPDQVVGNGPIAERLGVDDRWIVARTGVRERRIAPSTERLYEYAAAAGRRSLERAGLEPGEVDLVLVATMSHEQLTPSAAALVAAEIGAERAGVIDLGAACTGFVSGLGLASAQVESGRARTVLVIGADLLSRLTDRDDRSTAALFGDGAGAVVVGANQGRSGIGPVRLGAEGRDDLIHADRIEGLIRMRGPDTFREAVDRLSTVAEQSAADAGIGLDYIDLFAFHQANARITQAVGERLGLEPKRVIDCIWRYGNTSAASIPLALADAEADGRLVPGATVLLAAFGGGLTWGATVLQWGADDAG
jgi:3-oxoacyl-[acyl-carrier-protein] synthase III